MKPDSNPLAEFPFLQLDGGELLCHGYRFTLDTHEGRRASSGPLTLKKPLWMIARYARLAQQMQGARMVELGLWDGGSTAFFNMLLQPRLLLGFELDERPLDALEEYLSQQQNRPPIFTYCGVDQADSDRLLAEIYSRCDTGLLDLVVDDASHLLEPSRSSFETLFPLLREGGIYIVEDWSHEHQMAAAIYARIASGDLKLSTSEIAAAERPTPLGQLIAELLILAGIGDGVVSEVRARQGFAEIVRGPTPLSVGGFSVRERIGVLGRELLP